MEDNEQDINSNKLYRVDWKYIDLDKGVDEDYAYIGASDPIEATRGIEGTDFKVREASQEEMEAYVAGYDDGYDIAIVNERLKDLDLDDSNLISLDELQSIIDSMEATAEEDSEDEE